MVYGETNAVNYVSNCSLQSLKIVHLLVKEILGNALNEHRNVCIIGSFREIPHYSADIPEWSYSNLVRKYELVIILVTFFSFVKEFRKATPVSPY
jgi:hypothetical protein